MHMSNLKSLAMWIAAAWLFGAAPGARAAVPVPVPCGLGLVQNGLFHFAQMRQAGIPRGRVRVTYAGHSTFFIETSGGASAATDYNGVHLPPSVPQIVTMNNRHETHYTEMPDPTILHVLRGWDPKGGIARHEVRHKDMRVYNLPTNIINFGAGSSNGNSVFVFEAGGLCLAHLGHLAHFLSKQQVNRLGRIDVLFVPVDGRSTVSHDEAMHIVDQIRPRLVIPMHFAFTGPEEFAAMVAPRHAVRMHESKTIVLSRAMLPEKTEVLFLLGGDR